MSDALKQTYFRVWRPATMVVSLGLIAYVLYFNRLASLLPGYSAPELRALHNASSWHAITSNPVNVPYKLCVWLATAVLHHGIFATRVVAASFGTLAVIVFYAIIRPWYSFRAAFLGTILFATSAGFLHSARLGSGQVLQMSVLVFIGAVLWYRRARRQKVLVGYGMVMLFALLWYVPGMVWFELLGLGLLHKGALRQLRRMSTAHSVAWGVLFLAMITPLLIASLRNPQVALAATGLPRTVDSLSRIPSNLLDTVMSIGVRSSGNPVLWIGHAPLLNITELALGAIGAYYYVYRERSIRTIFLTVATVLSLVLISFGGSVGFTSLVPLLYLFISSGIDHLLGEWLAVFPRNPIARFTGVSVIVIVLFFSVLYQVRSYFVAWPHNDATRHAFNLHE